MKASADWPSNCIESITRLKPEGPGLVSRIFAPGITDPAPVVAAPATVRPCTPKQRGRLCRWYLELPMGESGACGRFPSKPGCG